MGYNNLTLIVSKKNKLNIQILESNKLNFIPFK